MNKENKNVIQVVILLIILVIVIVFAVKVLNKNNKKENKSEKVTETSAVNPDDPAYQNMTVYGEDNKIKGATSTKLELNKRRK